MENENSTKEIITISKELDIKMEIETESLPVKEGISIRCATRLLPNKWLKLDDKKGIYFIENP